MVFSKAEGTGEKGKTCQSPARHTRAAQGPFIHNSVCTHFKICFYLCARGCGYCTCVQGVQGGQEKASDPLELELHVVVSLLTPVQEGLEQQAFLAAKLPLQRLSAYSCRKDG